MTQFNFKNSNILCEHLSTLTAISSQVQSGTWQIYLEFLQRADNSAISIDGTSMAHPRVYPNE